MEYIYAALLLHKLGKEINEENLKAVIKAAGAEPDDAKIKVLLSALEGVNIDEAIEKGMQAQTAVVAAPAQASETKEEKKEEAPKEEKKSDEEAMAGLSALFG